MFSILGSPYWITGGQRGRASAAPSQAGKRNSAYVKVTGRDLVEAGLAPYRPSGR